MEVDNEKVEAEKSEIAEMKDSEEEEEEEEDVGEAMTDSEAPTYAVSDRTIIHGQPCIHCMPKPMSCLSRSDVLTFDQHVQIEHEAKNARDEELKTQKETQETQETQEAQSQDAQEAEAAEEDEAAEADKEDEEAEAEEDLGETQEAPEAPEVPEAHQIVAADSNVGASEYCFIGWRNTTGAAFE